MGTFCKVYTLFLHIPTKRKYNNGLRLGNLLIDHGLQTPKIALLVDHFLASQKNRYDPKTS